MRSNGSDSHARSSAFRRGASSLLTCLALLAWPAPATHADPARDARGGSPVVYTNDFEAPVGSEWSESRREATPSGRFGHFLGEFGNDTVRLRLTNLGSHAHVSVSFDLFIIRSWDGNDTGCCGPDVWEARVEGGPTLVHTTFGNGTPLNRVDNSQAFPDTFPGGSNFPQTGAAEVNSLGFVFSGGGLQDAVYHLDLSFAHTASSVEIVFAGSNLQPLDDESWGLDNVRVLAGDGPGVAVVDAISPAVICPDGRTGNQPDLRDIRLELEQFDGSASSVFICRRPDGGGDHVAASQVSVVGDAVSCKVDVAQLRRNVPYFPFVVSASGEVSSGFGPVRHPRGLDVFFVVSTSSVTFSAPSGTGSLQPPQSLGAEPACDAGSSAARGSPPGLVGYRVYSSNRSGVEATPMNFFAMLPPSQTEFGGAPYFNYVVTAVYDAGESARTNEVRLAPAVVDTVTVSARRLVAKGSGFTSTVRVFFDGVPFAAPAKVAGGRTLKQSGSLTNGMSLSQFLTPGRTTVITFRNSDGTESVFRFTAP